MFNNSRELHERMPRHTKLGVYTVNGYYSPKSIISSRTLKSGSCRWSFAFSPFDPLKWYRRCVWRKCRGYNRPIKYAIPSSAVKPYEAYILYFSFPPGAFRRRRGLSPRICVRTRAWSVSYEISFFGNNAKYDYTTGRLCTVITISVSEPRTR